MARIPFDIKYRPHIENGEYKVVTERGFPVKVMDWEYNDRIGGKGIAIKIIESDGDRAMLYTYEGKRAPIFQVEDRSDLFIITPEPELSEFEKELESFYNHHLQVCTYDNQGTIEDSLHDGASKLLAIARKELLEEQYTSDPHKTDLYKLGKSETLKSLPRWKKADRDIISNTIEFAVPYTNDGGDHADWVEVIVTNVVHKGENYFEISELEKLPGFNE